MINKKLLSFRRRSFYIDGLLICKNIVIFFQTNECCWFSLTIGDGDIFFLEEKNEPILESLSTIQDSFAYPIENLSNLEFAKEKVVEEIYVYRLYEDPAFIFGIYFKLNTGGFSIIESDGDLSIISGIAEELLEFSQLKIYHKK